MRSAIPAALACLVLSGAAFAAPAGKPVPKPLSRVLSMNASSTGPGVEASNPASGMRGKAQKQAAETLGLQTGAAWRYKQIDKLLKSRAALLSQTYDFKHLLMDDGKVLPPVIVEADGSFSVQNDSEAVATQRTYKIVKPARIVGGAPSWRDYLYKDYPPAKQVNQAILPKNGAESRRWRKYVRKGWKEGVAQANRVFRIALSRLTRDYLGMLRFKRLAMANVVSAPMLAAGKVGIVVGHHRLQVGQKVFRLTVPAHFNGAGKWSPVIARQHGGGH